MPNINLKYPFFNEYDTEKKMEVLYMESKLETNNGTKKEDLTNIVKFAGKQVFQLDTRLDWSNRALSDIEDLCVEFHETGPHDPEKALKIVMQMYDLAHERLLEEAK